MTHLSLDKIAKRFGGLQAVSELSVDVSSGEIVGLIGPNGAGKTTVVNLITGMLKASSGEISLDGKDITHETAVNVARLGIARTFQNIRLLKHSTVLENVLIGFHRQGRTSMLANMFGLPSVWREQAEFEEKAHSLLKRFHMQRFAQQPAGSLSYGHQRRVEMMRALASSPGVLLLDEPVAGMNDTEAHDLGILFRELANGGLAVLLIEHNMRFVNAISDRLCVLNAGKMIAKGSPNEVMSNPQVIEAYLGPEKYDA